MSNNETKYSKLINNNSSAYLFTIKRDSASNFFRRRIFSAHKRRRIFSAHQTHQIVDVVIRLKHHILEFFNVHWPAAGAAGGRVPAAGTAGNAPARAAENKPAELIPTARAAAKMVRPPAAARAAADNRGPELIAARLARVVDIIITGVVDIIITGAAARAAADNRGPVLRRF